IYTLWHGRLLPLTYYHRRQNIATLISQSSDGEYIARVVERWGYTAIRGSSSRGGSGALREMVKLARAGRSMAITPDGPRGPRQQLKPGVLTLAQLTSQPMIPMSASATRAWWVDARWDLFLVPKPFATVYVRYAEPVYVPRDADEHTIARIGEQVQATLVRLTEETDADARG
ncbi:MAG TPA: lysophospholipid acyltransferase family protein, partial [Longimicrobiales bacterium]